MILNYRVELCRQCYYKRTRRCGKSDLYIHNLTPAEPGGECKNHRLVPWVPYY